MKHKFVYIFMRYLFLFITFCLLGSICMAQTVSNVWFEQEGNTIKIYYDLSEKANIRIYLSTDGGKSFESSPLKNVVGNVGKNVKSGKGKVAVWDVLSSREKLQGERVCFKVRAINSQYVDLGLPSGTLWKKENEDGFYAYDEAVKRFGEMLPTKEQLKELKDKCRWSWNGSGYKVTGPNGNSIVLPAAGYRYCSGIYVGSDGCYWSSTPGGSDYAWGLYFYSGSVSIINLDRCYGRSVRLVQD